MNIFCLRNLTQVVNVPGRKRNTRKRLRDDCLGPRVTKHRRLHSSKLGQHLRHDTPVVQTANGLDHSSSQSSSSGVDGPEDVHHTVELISSSSRVKESLKPQEVRVKPKAPKKAARFGDLLAQMRANTSMIVRETC